MLEINQIHQGNSAELLKQIDDNSIDLTVTSPPYDNLRDYKGYSFNFETIAKELFRITKEGGIVVWVVGDATINGSETGTSFRQVLFFMDCGFRLHDTMIYKKSGAPPRYPNIKRYTNCFEYMFILTKGNVGTFNELKDRRNISANTSRWSGQRQKDGSIKRTNIWKTEEISGRFNIWEYGIGYNQTTKESYAFQHPAMFPEKLAKDHILSWSNKGDLVLDPFVGSGTTCKIAKLQGRKFIGIDISEEYCKLAKKRIRQESLLPLVDKKEGGKGIPPTNKLVGILPKIL